MNTAYSMDNALYAFSESRQQYILVDEWATESCKEHMFDKYKKDMGFNFLMECKYELIKFAQDEEFAGNFYFKSGNYAIGYGSRNKITKESKLQNSQGTNINWTKFLVEIIQEAIIAYPEAKARADRENAIRRNAYAMGKKAGRRQEQNKARIKCISQC